MSLRRRPIRTAVASMGKRRITGRDRSDRRGSWQLATKHALDFVGAALLLLVLLPTLLTIACAIRLTMGGPVLFRQFRVGRLGVPVEILKFRTMAAKAGPERPDLGTGMAGEAVDIGRLGRFLRATSLDELPQLINVLRGEMSFVGPRPVPEYVIAHIPGCDLRHRVRPGITGWAQIQGAGRGPDRDTTEELSYRVQLDNDYIDNWSLWLDAKIFCLTIPAVLRFPQTAASSPVAIEREVPVAQAVATEAPEPVSA